MKFKRFICMITAVVIIFTMPVLAFAQVQKDTAGNVIAADEEQMIEEDSFFGGFATGRDLSVKNCEAEDTVCMAGMNLDLTSTKTGGSAFLAGYSINISDSQIGGNIAAAGEKVAISKDTSARSVKAAGKDVSFEGSAKALDICAHNVYIDGEIDGDVNVNAEKVTIGDNAKITGTLTVEAEDEADISSAAYVGEYVFDKIEKQTYSVRSTVKDCIFAVICMAVMALLMCLLVPSYVAGSAEMIRKKTGVMLGSGAIVLVALPFAFILLCVSVIGVPLAFAIGLAAAAVMVASVPFAGASLASLVFPQWNRYLSAAAGAAVLVVLVHIPYIGFVVRIGAWIYALGYVLQRIWDGRARRKPSETAPAQGEYEQIEG